jgi:hypothetical protein
MVFPGPPLQNRKAIKVYYEKKIIPNLELYEQQLLITREIGDRRGEGNALNNLGNAHEILGDIPQAILLTTQALAIYEAIESPSANQARAKLTALRSSSSK